MTKVVSTKQQLERLVSLMNENPQVAKGVCSKVLIKSKWEEIAIELNSLGPPIRATTKWIKVWADMKSKLKGKMRHNNAEYRATGGGPNTLQGYTSTEEAVISLLQLHSCVNPPGKEFGVNRGGSSQRVESPLNQSPPHQSPPNEAPPNEAPQNETPPNDTQEAVIINQSENATHGKKRKRNSKTDRMALLEEQTDAQTKYYQTMTATMEQIKKSAEEAQKYAKRTFYLKKDTYKELLKLKRAKIELLKKQLKN